MGGEDASHSVVQLRDGWWRGAFGGLGRAIGFVRGGVCRWGTDRLGWRRRICWIFLAGRPGGLGVEADDVGRGSAGCGVVGVVAEAEVLADVGDDVVDVAAGEVVFEVLGVEALEEFGLQAFAVAAGGFAVDAVLDGAEDALAGEAAVEAGCGCGAGRLGHVPGEEDGLADGAGEAGEGPACGFGGLGVLRGIRLGFGLGVALAGEACAHVDEVVEDVAVVLGVFGLLGGGLRAWDGSS